MLTGLVLPFTAAATVPCQWTQGWAAAAIQDPDDDGDSSLFKVGGWVRSLGGLAGRHLGGPQGGVQGTEDGATQGR